MYLNSKLRFHFHEVFALYFGYCFMPFSFIHFRLFFLAFLSFILSFFRFWYKFVSSCNYIKNISVCLLSFIAIIVFVQHFVFLQSCSAGFSICSVIHNILCGIYSMYIYVFVWLFCFFVCLFFGKLGKLAVAKEYCLR